MNPTDNLERFKGFEFIAPGTMLDAELELKLEETCPYSPEKRYVPEYKFRLVNTKTEASRGNISLRVGLTEN